MDEEQRALEDKAHAERLRHDAREYLDGTASSWKPVDAAVVIAGGLDLAQPELLHRVDGRALLYAGKTHSFVGEPESGKTWMALAAAAEQVDADRNVLYVDFEDGPKGVIRRMLSLGVAAARVGKLFHYMRPEESIIARENKKVMAAVGLLYRPSLIVLDGVTECMARHSWDINSATDTARFLDTFPRLWDQTGAAVVLIDHVVKARDSQGRWAIGSQHKLAGVNGASYVFTVDEPFGRGRTGAATISVAKDREGAVREYAVAAPGGQVAGTFQLEGGPDGTVRWSLAPYDAGTRLLTLSQKILNVLAFRGPLNKTELHKAVGGDRNLVWIAMGELTESGRLTVTAGDKANEKIVALAG